MRFFSGNLLEVDLSHIPIMDREDDGKPADMSEEDWKKEKTYAYMMSMTEVDLLLAEVELKNLGSTGVPSSKHLADAVTHSTIFWYNMNSYTVCDKDR